MLHRADPFQGLPRGYYGAILADPPWRFQTWSPKGMGRAPDYLTMTPGQICALPVDELAARDCVLCLWMSWPMLQQALQVIDRWRFTYKTCAFAWIKANGTEVAVGTGYWTRANSECCLLATRGKPKRINADVRQAIIEPRREHSRKPDCVYRRIERLVAGPYLELFARQRRPGWDCWGHEVDKFEYKPRDDFSRSIEECYRAVRERVAAGGPKWVPK
jgi:N6-adenosine-specific RNA methylase IME4